MAAYQSLLPRCRRLQLLYIRPRRPLQIHYTRLHHHLCRNSRQMASITSPVVPRHHEDGRVRLSLRTPLRCPSTSILEKVISSHHRLLHTHLFGVRMPAVSTPSTLRPKPIRHPPGKTSLENMVALSDALVSSRLEHPKHMILSTLICHQEIDLPPWTRATTRLFHITPQSSQR